MRPLVNHAFLLSLVFLLLAACQKETVSKGENAPAVVVDDSAPTPKKNEIVAARGQGPLLADWTKALERTSLDLRIRRPSIEDRNAFMNLTNEVLVFLRSAKSVDERKPYLSAFVAAYLYGCDNDGKGCNYSNYFSSHPAVSSIGVIAADDAGDDIVLRYRILRTAFSSQNVDVENVALMVAYLRTAARYEAHLATLQDKNSKNRLLQHQEIVDQLLIDLTNPAKAVRIDRTMMASLADGFHVWDFDRARRQDTATREALVLKVVASEILDKDKLAKAYQDITEKPGNLAGKLTTFLKDRPTTAKTLGLETNLPHNLTTVILENLWLNRMTLSEAKIFWDQYMKSVPEKDWSIAKRKAQFELLAYVKNRLFVTSQDVNNILITFFQSPGRFVTADAFGEALKEALTGQVMWSEAIARFILLQNFNDQNLRLGHTRDKIDSDLTFFFAGLNRNIKLLSTYPSMLIMSYHLARLKFSLKLFTWGGVVKIEAGKILDWFFQGSLFPWLPYGSDKTPLSKSEIALVYHYALELGAISGGGIDIKTLFQMMTEQMVGPLREEVNTMTRQFTRAYDNNPRINEFYQICDSLKKARNTGAPWPRLQSNLVELKKYSYLGLPQGSNGSLSLHPAFHGAWQYFETPEGTYRRLDTSFEIVRTEFTPAIDLLDLYANITRSFWSRHESPAAVQPKYDEVQAQYASLKSLRKSFYSLMFKLTDRIGKCGETIVKSEIEAQAYAVKGLIAHFKDVYRSMNEARHSKGNLNAVNGRFGFKKSVKMAGLSSHEAALGFTVNSYRVSRLQLFLRVASIFENGYKDGENTVAPLFAPGSFIIADRMKDAGVVWNEREVIVDWYPTEDEFVTSAFQKVFDPDWEVFDWYSKSGVTTSIGMRLGALAALAKSGPQETDDGIKSLTVSELLRATLEAFRSIDLDETAVQVLNITARLFRGSRYDVAYKLEGVAREKGNQHWMGLLDSTYKLITDDAGGDADNDTIDRGSQGPRIKSGNGAVATFQAHVLSMRSLGEPSLTVPVDIVTALDRYYSSRIDFQLSVAAKTINEAKRLTELRKKVPQVFPTWRVFSDQPDPQVPVLSRAAIEIFDGKIRELSNDFGYSIPAEFSEAERTY